MMVAANATLYVFALALAIAVISPLPENAPRRIRVARAGLVACGSMTVAGAVVLAVLGLWFGLTRMSPQRDDDDEEDDDGGGSHRRTDPPEPTQPAGDGPSDDLWADFDAARAEWERDGRREPVGA